MSRDSRSDIAAALARRRLGCVAIGASAGGIDALFTVLEDLPASGPVPLVCVLHLPTGHDSKLAEIFGARLRLRVTEARPGERLAAGTLYFAPADYHLLVEPDRSFSLSCEAPINYSRPAIDALFDSCAEAFGPALLALLLTGANDDGARGLARVRAAGGLAVVQDPAEAQHPAMPQAALDRAGADLVLPLSRIRELLATLMRS
ncbi:chemotaxis protein CheB [Ramlibacter rhizophilus]|uniref:protein-glutamate methylesterase n=1 Tax=Ramlibacter rhizophilus TaxID=1781167 RepID=A0A4Z0BMT8_9BURK|nr:chemotaxis protein CheB [Ramlibacter rhizophilus]TFY99567.1 chemotaxis protein CheB [Ramlibacter rhizophilus]